MTARDLASPIYSARVLAFWMIAQVAALALAAGRFPLSAHFFEPAERMAVEELLIIQLVVASLTFPLLLRSAYGSFVTMITAIAMIFLANALSRYPLRQLVSSLVYLEACLLAMAIWAHLLRNLRSQLIDVCVSGGLTVFMTALWYLSREYRPDAPDWLQYFSPISAVIRLLDESGKIWAFASLPATFLLVGIVIRAARRTRVGRT